MGRFPLLALGLLVTAAGCGGGEPWPAPPEPTERVMLDPLIRRIVEERLEGLTQYPGDVEGRLKLGMFYAGNDMHSLAAETYEQILAREPDRFDTWYYLADARHEREDAAGAAAAMQRAIELDPSVASAHWQKGRYHLELGELDEAITCFTEATRLDPRNSCGWMGLARARLQSGETEAAVAALRELLARGSSNRKYAHHLLGTALQRLGKTREAQLHQRTEFVEARWPDSRLGPIRSLKSGYWGTVTRAKTLVTSGKVDEGIELLLQLKAERDVSIDVYSNLALAYATTGRVDEAIVILEDGLATSPSSAGPQQLLAGCYLTKAKSTGGDEARLLMARVDEHLVRSLEVDPHYVPALGLRGDVYELREQYDLAVASWREAFRWNPDEGAWMERALEVLQRVGTSLQVAECAEEYARRAIPSADLWRRAGDAWMSAGRLTEAEAALVNAQELANKNDEELAASLVRLRALKNE